MAVVECDELSNRHHRWSRATPDIIDACMIGVAVFSQQINGRERYPRNRCLYIDIAEFDGWVESGAKRSHSREWIDTAGLRSGEPSSVDNAALRWQQSKRIP